ncbi:hypothetical protein BDZ94DRAFT_1248437 [Collybia nuda]|uniref:Uncharacterized protein n=1 Tax=Collybia nuda TaxID=64659 RepID=A0A9P5YE32_9AGAR|nr:hypothetical protein BDZ94DRAFT_1248437 [Collybia nuda]
MLEVNINRRDFLGPVRSKILVPAPVNTRPSITDVPGRRHQSSHSPFMILVPGILDTPTTDGIYFRGKYSIYTSIAAGHIVIDRTTTKSHLQPQATLL